MSLKNPLIFTFLWTFWGGLIAYAFRYGTGIWGPLAWLILGLFVARRQRLSNHLQKSVSLLKQERRVQADFISLAVHEINTPLAALNGRLDMLIAEDGATLTEDQRQKFQPVIAAARRFTALLSDLKDSVRFAGHWQLVVGQSDLRPILTDCWDEIQPLLDRTLPHRLSLPPGRLLIRGDDDRLRQIFRNLLSNAAKYAQDQPISLSLGLRDQRYQIEVRDRGVGIAPDELPHLGERFFQSQSPHHQPGTGLGLFIVRQLVDAHQGTLSFHSAGLGQGLVVVVELPHPEINHAFRP